MLFPLQSGCRTSQLCLKCQQHTALQICLATGKSVILSVLLMPPTRVLPLGGSLLCGLGAHVQCTVALGAVTAAKLSMQMLIMLYKKLLCKAMYDST